MGVGVGVELGGRDGGHAELHDQEPAEAEVARAASHVRGEVIVRRQPDARHVDEHKVAAFGVRVLCLVFWWRVRNEGCYVGWMGIGFLKLRKRKVDG